MKMDDVESFAGCDDAHVTFSLTFLMSVFRGQSFGGYFQWVLDAPRETVEWPYQPLGFDSIAFRIHSAS